MEWTRRENRLKVLDGKRGKKRKRYEKLVQTAIMLLLLLMLCITLFLAYEGIRYSNFSTAPYTQRYLELSDSTIRHLFIFGGICLLTGLVLVGRLYLLRFKVYEKFLGDEEKICRIMLLMACTWLTVIGYLYLKEHPYYPAGDQINITAGAAYARDGNFVMFSRGGYIALFEYQKGFLFLYEVLFTIFGNYCFGVAQKFHLCFLIITLVAGYAFLKIVAGKPIYRILYCVMMMFSIPYIIFLPYIYGDLPSICFSMVLFWALAAYAKYNQKRYLVTGSIAAALALLVRTHTWIVLIAVGIGMVLLAMEKKTLRPILAGLCILLIARGSVKAVDIMYEYRSGYESGVEIPLILSIAMGMQETEGYPGIFNRFHQDVYELCGYEREPAIQVGKEYISLRLREFKENPAYTKYFFVKKLKMQWLEPLFEGLYATKTFHEEIKEIPNWVTSLYYGKLHDIVWKFANYYQSVVYLAMLCFVAGSLMRRGEYLTGSAGYVPLIAVAGGFLFSIIWESQCRYVLPYYMYMIIYAPVGIGKIAEAISEFGNSFLDYDIEDTSQSGKAAA